LRDDADNVWTTFEAFRRFLLSNIPVIVPCSSKLRSAVSNDPFRLPGVDMRSLPGPRFRDLAADFAGELGGVDSPGRAKCALVRQAAMDMLRAETMQGAALHGEGVDHEELTRAGNSAIRTLTRLGIKRAARAVRATSRLDMSQEVAS
jgi:hypothetical protein